MVKVPPRWMGPEEAAEAAADGLLELGEALPDVHAASARARTPIIGRSTALGWTVRMFMVDLLSPAVRVPVTNPRPRRIRHVRSGRQSCRSLH
jgi:hypothetical protein